VNKTVEGLTKIVSEIEVSLSKMNAPDRAVDKRIETVKGKEVETNEECETARKGARKTRSAFERVKAERMRRFQNFFEPVSQRIDEIYKVEKNTNKVEQILQKKLIIFIGIENR
jgi:structural maintenance of chromosome 1